MNQKDYFTVGCKLLGVYCLVSTLPYFVATLQLYFVPKNLPEDYDKMMFITRIGSLAIPVLLTVLGIYLIKDNSFIYKFIYSGEKTSLTMNLEAKFILLIKMLGIYLIIGSIPDLLKAISSFLVYMNAPKYYDIFREKQFTYLNALSSIGSILFGLYLLKSGKIFLRIARIGPAINMGHEKDG